MTVTTDVLQPSARLGDHHEVVRFIAEGASANVYEARDLRTGAAVAIKLLRAPTECDDDPVARFEAETAACRRLDSPYLVRLLGTGRLGDERPYLVLELLRGATLKQRLATRGRLPLDTAIQIGRQLYLALDAVHRAGLVHRDVKPRNVIVLEKRGGFSVKLLDFGIAELLPSDGDTTATLHCSEYAMGTPAYMPPEQLAGSIVDERADIYSAGVLLYEMVTGRRPFQAPDLASLTRSVLVDPAAPPGRLRSTCPPALEELILRTLEKDRDRRPRTARTVAEALDGIARSRRPGTGAEAFGKNRPRSAKAAKSPRKRSPASQAGLAGSPSGKSMHERRRAV